MRRRLLFMLALTTAFSISDAMSQADGTRRRAVGRRPADVQPVLVEDDFRNGPLGWEARFADYSPVNEDMQLDAGIRALPSELGVIGTGFMITGNNHSDDLFMFLTKKLDPRDGVRPGQRYRVRFRIVFASNAGGQNCGGIGGAPGLGVYLKAGATGEEPRVELDELNHYRVTVDTGNQSIGGTAASVAGTISTGLDECSSDAPFHTIDRVHEHPHVVTANASGEIWLIVGTDSAFEGITRLYYQRIEAVLTPAP